MMPVFHDAKLQQEFNERGYVRFQGFGQEVIRELTETYRKLGLRDEMRAGYKVSLYNSAVEVRRKAQEYLISKAFPHVEPFLVGRKPYMATYLVKEPSGCVIWAHQDWTHCNEKKHESLMCWIPLCDVNEENSALGFINGSHSYFDYIRAFPYQIGETPVERYRLKLIPYLNLLNMKAGEAVVFSNKTIHGSLSNYTNKERVALSFALCPEDEALLFYYLKPNSAAQSLLRYEVNSDFYLEYNQPRLMKMYAQRNVIEDYPWEEIPYQVEAIEWEEMERMLESSGNRRDSWMAARAEDFYKAKIYA